MQMTAALLVVAAVLTPWVIRNYEKFDHRIVLSTNEGKTLAGANCPSVYYGHLLGYWDNSCVGHDALATSDEAEYNKVLTAQGKRYIKAHLSRVPLVVAVRVLRAWGLYEPLQQAQLEVVQSRSIGGAAGLANFTDRAVLGYPRPVAAVEEPSCPGVGGRSHSSGNHRGCHKLRQSSLRAVRDPCTVRGRCGHPGGSQ